MPERKLPTFVDGVAITPIDTQQSVHITSNFKRSEHAYLTRSEAAEKQAEIRKKYKIPKGATYQYYFALLRKMIEAKEYDFFADLITQDFRLG